MSKELDLFQLQTRANLAIVTRADAMKIAPQDMLALLERLDLAEKNANTYQTLYEQRAESLEQAEQALEATERQVVARSGETAAERIWRRRAEAAEQDAYGFRKGYEILNNALVLQAKRLEAAEQAVARVRELAKMWLSEIPGPVYRVQLLDVHEQLISALGGEQS